MQFNWERNRKVISKRSTCFKFHEKKYEKFTRSIYIYIRISNSLHDPPHPPPPLLFPNRVGGKIGILVYQKLSCFFRWDIYLYVHWTGLTPFNLQSSRNILPNQQNLKTNKNRAVLSEKPAKSVWPVCSSMNRYFVDQHEEKPFHANSGKSKKKM